VNQGGKKACVWLRRDGCRDGLPDSCLCVGYQDIMPSRLDANSFIVFAFWHFKINHLLDSVMF
jgi:hypothetical protein